jgi:hypothetical protein
MPVAQGFPQLRQQSGEKRAPLFLAPLQQVEHLVGGWMGALDIL